MDDPDRVMDDPDTWISVKVPQWRNIYVSCSACDSFVYINDTNVSKYKRGLVRNILVSVMNTKFPFLKLKDEPGAPDADTRLRVCGNRSHRSNSRAATLEVRVAILQRVITAVMAVQRARGLRD